MYVKRERKVLKSRKKKEVAWQTEDIYFKASKRERPQGWRERLHDRRKKRLLSKRKRRLASKRKRYMLHAWQEKEKSCLADEGEALRGKERENLHDRKKERGCMARERGRLHCR
jgi:hypothetical protein